MEVESGDEETGFEVLAANQYEALTRVAHRILGCSSEAEDVVQDTLTAVWKRRAEIGLVNIEAYVFRAVQINALKCRARRREHVSLDTPDAINTAVAANEDEDAESAIQIDPLTLEKALAGLPETQQAVIRMKYYVGLSFREIGVALSISSNTAASRCRYALNALKKMLK